MDREEVDVGDELRARRAEFWAAVAPIATGTFIALVAFALLAYAVARIWVDANF